jgi:tryptophan-rich sensory protein
MNTKNYKLYSDLKKPSWAPPSFLFAPVWTFLYILIAISFGYVFLMVFKNEISFVIAIPFILNLIFNFLFTPLQFGLKNIFLASIDILLVILTLLWASIAIFPIASWVFYAQIPYILWVLFAGYLEFNILIKN